MKTAKEFLSIALGGNMNISTLKPKAWHEIMTDYAKYYHKLENKALEESRDELLKHLVCWRDGFKAIGGEAANVIDTNKVIKKAQALKGKLKS